jgi:hypothetical protein
LKPTLGFIIFNNPVRTSKRTPHFTITKINWLMLFKEIIAVCNAKHKKYKIQIYGVLKKVGHILTTRL